MSNLLRNLQDHTNAIIDQHNIPAVSLAVWHNNQLYQAASGVLNINTGVEATTDSIFQIGSITKVFTASLVMQLVDQGRVNLDTPVKTYLQDFQIADPEATQTITVRQLLNHSNGIAGDFFPDDNNAQGNAIARYLDRINLIPLVHPPGANYSYSNAAFVVAGRLVEVLTGLPWHQAMEERIFKPLGMAHSTADSKETLRYRAAIGHFPDADNPQKWRLSPKCYSSQALAPAGTTPTMTAADLITFARAHLNGGKASSGEQWLSTNSIQLMQTPSVALPSNSGVVDQHWGLGWGVMIHKDSGIPMVWHSGLVAGQTSMLRLFPEQDLVFAILVNGAKAGVMDAIANDVMKDLTGLDTREPECSPIKLGADRLAVYTGTFESFDAVYHIAVNEHLTDSDSVALAVSRTDKLHKITSQLTWLPRGEHVFASLTDQGVRLPNVVLIANKEDTAPNQLFVGNRLNHRLGFSYNL